MRTEKVLHNSAVFLITQPVVFLLQLITRRVFVMYLSVELLGFQSVFGNVFSIFSAADLGVSGIITFHLYRALENKDTKEICILMKIFRVYYRAVAVIIALCGALLYFFLPYIAKNSSLPWNLTCVIYFIYLASSVLSYALSYWNAMFECDQRKYEIEKVNTVYKFFATLMKLIAIAVFKNFLAYLLIDTCYTLFCNLTIGRKVRARYPYLKENTPICFAQIKERGMWDDCKNGIIHRIAIAVYTGTDSIVISSMCSVALVGLYSSYLTITTLIEQVLLYKLLDPIAAAVGSLLYSKTSLEHKHEVFQGLSTLMLFIGGICGCVYMVTLQPFIVLWLGSEEFLLPISFVQMFVATVCLRFSEQTVCWFRNAVGNYARDRNAMAASAIVNLGVSVLLAPFWGVTGVQLGTLLATLLLLVGRSVLVVKDYFARSLIKYWASRLALISVFLAEAVFLNWMMSNWPQGIGGLLLRGGVGAIVPMATGVLLLHKTKGFLMLFLYAKQSIQVVKNKFLRKTAQKEQDKRGKNG